MRKAVQAPEVGGFFTGAAPGRPLPFQAEVRGRYPAFRSPIAPCNRLDQAS